MNLSIIIVNYNVKYFLEQCLLSVQKACENITAEIFVVDNNSVDGSVEMIQARFPGIQLIANKDNKGFSKANNQAIRTARGKYILLLNPDTIVEEDTFEKVIAFMNEHPDAGGLGVKMIDGSGKFLPESKRGLPSPSVAFYKIFGFAALFPKSRKFGKYHLGFLNPEETNEVDVLSGAFMLLRKECLDKIGLLDETFFMYGEDIDLSYRVQLGGYKNYYFPETRIIHYKGESTKKSSVNYVFVFYKAMIIFAEKHFSQKNAKLFAAFINVAVYLRAGVALLTRFIKMAFLPMLDAALLFLSMYFLKNYWQQNIKYDNGDYYPPEFMYVAVPFYITGWIIAVYFSGGYDKPIKLPKIIRGIATGTILILVVYALLPETQRYSRALILLGSVCATICMVTLRLLFNVFKIKAFALDNNRKKRIVIVGNAAEANRVVSLLKQADTKANIIGFVKPDNKDLTSEYMGSANRIAELVEVFKVDEVIFCAKDVSAHDIITQMSLVSGKLVECKIAPPESLYIIGSNSIDSNGELYTIDINSINKPSNIRSKRLADVSLSLLLLITLPLGFFGVKNKANFIANIFRVFIGRTSWVGYKVTGSHMNTLPKIKAGVISQADTLAETTLDDNTIMRLNMLYAKDYKVYNDIAVMYKSFSKLGNNVA